MLAVHCEQLDRTLEERQVRTLHGRFANIAAQLGYKIAAVRLAVIRAMAIVDAIADEEG